MTVFISYARRDLEVVTRLHGDLERAGLAAWFDNDVHAGERWWDRILDQVQACDLFLFVISPDSIRSRSCRAEVAFAAELGRPMLPVLVRDTRIDLAPGPIAVTQYVDYRNRTPEAAISFVMAATATRASVPLPDPLPDRPQTPVHDLGPVQNRLGAIELGFAAQQEIVAELRRNIDDLDQRDVLIALLDRLRRRPDVVASVAAEVEELLAELPDAESVRAVAQQSMRRRRLVDRDADVVNLLRSMVTQIRAGHFTPILGPGLTDALTGPRRLLAREWARMFEFPMAEYQHDDLPGVAQFVAVTTDSATMHSNLAEYMWNQLVARGGDPASSDLRGLLRGVWEREHAENEYEPHAVLSSLPCPIYVNAHPSALLADALRAAGRDPVVELCRWKPDVYDWPASVFETDPEYVPSPERPLVYQVFGTVEFVDSLVVTEDDYLDFLVGVTHERALIPPVVRRKLADSALLLLGFGLADWDVRVLLRTLISQEGSRKLNRYTHIAAQVDLTSGVVSPARAQRYLEKYFGKHREPSMDIYWGTVEEFAADLAEMWGAKR